MTNKGKPFEDKFRKDFLKSIPGSWVFRLHDQTNGYKEVSGNPCDFICFAKNKLFLVECKTHKGQSIPFAAIPQYERLLKHKNYEGINPGIVIWFSEQDIVIWVPITEAEKMVNNGEKSIGLRMLKTNLYNIIEIPSIKRRTFLDSDYSCLLEIL